MKTFKAVSNMNKTSLIDMQGVNEGIGYALLCISSRLTKFYLKIEMKMLHDIVPHLQKLFWTSYSIHERHYPRNILICKTLNINVLPEIFKY